MDEDRRDIIRESITFDSVDQFGSKIEPRNFFYDQIVSYAAFTAPRPPHDGCTAAQSIITLRNKTEDGLFASKSFYTAHDIDTLKTMFEQAEANIAARKPQELKEMGKIRMDFLRATITLNVTDQPLAGKTSEPINVFYDQIVGHGPYTLTTQYYPVPFAQSYVLLKNDGCFGTRKLYVTEFPADLTQLYDTAEQEMCVKAVKLLRQLNL